MARMTAVRSGSTLFFDSQRARMAGEHEARKGGDYHMTISEWLEFAKANWKKEEGQTMAEYGVVLGVITVLAIGAFTLLSGGITGAINKVTSILPK